MSDGLTVDDDGAAPLTVDRATSNGDVITLQKNGSTVGSVGVTADGAYIAGKTDTALFLNDTDDNIYTITTGLNNRDNTTDLGRSNARFKDLYLGGGLYIGGTGSANALNDYEEGTWTPASTGTATYIEQFGRYRKVGDVVYIMFVLEINNIGTGEQERNSGLPFAAARECTIHASKFENINLSIVDGTLRTSNTYLYLTHRTAASTSSTSNSGFLKNNARVQASGWYHTSD